MSSEKDYSEFYTLDDEVIDVLEMDDSMSSIIEVEPQPLFSADAIAENGGDDDTITPTAFGVINIILKSAVPPLTPYFDRFKAALMMNASIRSISETDICALFPTELGLRGLFRESLRKFRAAQEENTEENVQDINKIDEFRSFSSWKKTVSIVISSRCSSSCFAFIHLQNGLNLHFVLCFC